MKKVFSVKNSTLRIENGFIELWGDADEENTLSIGKCRQMYATNNPDLKDFELIYTLPSTLIRNQTDEELAEDWSKDYHFASSKQDVAKESFFAGRKSVGGDYHLTREEFEKVIHMARATHFIGAAKQYSHNLETIIDKLTPPIYPHTITVEHDGEKYYWETLKAEY
jgi:hypothetical protein